MRSKKEMQPEKLGLMHEVATKSHNLVKELVKPIATFSLVVMKCQFFNDVEDRCLAARVTDLLKADLVPVLAAQE